MQAAAAHRAIDAGELSVGLLERAVACESRSRRARPSCSVGHCAARRWRAASSVMPALAEPRHLRLRRTRRRRSPRSNSFRAPVSYSSGTSTTRTAIGSPSSSNAAARGDRAIAAGYARSLRASRAFEILEDDRAELRRSTSRRRTRPARRRRRPRDRRRRRRRAAARLRRARRVGVECAAAHRVRSWSSTWHGGPRDSAGDERR